MQLKEVLLFYREINMFWGIPRTSLFDHLYGKAKSRKIEPPSVLI